MTQIIAKFVQLQKQNPLLIMEAMFRFQSKEIKDMVLYSYGSGLAPLGDKDLGFKEKSKID